MSASFRICRKKHRRGPVSKILRWAINHHHTMRNLRYATVEPKMVNISWCPRILPPARTACGRSWTRKTSVTVTRSPTVPTAVPASPLSKIFPMTAPRPPCVISGCVHYAGTSITTRSTGAFIPSPTPARCAARTWNSSMPVVVLLPARMPLLRPASCSIRGKLWR